MATPLWNISKVSGVIRILPTGTLASKNYFGSVVGKFDSNGSVVYLQINGDPYQFLYSDVQINGAIPSTVSEALSLLQAILGT